MEGGPGRNAVVVCLAAGMVLAAAWAHGQSFPGLQRRGDELSTFRPPGAGVEEPLNRKQEIERGIAEARWRLGGLRIDPWVGIRELVVVLVGEQGTIPGEPQSEGDDLGVTAGAGVRAFLPLGDVVLSGAVIPEYTWWSEDEASRRSNVNVGLDLDAFLNRVQLHFGASRREELEQISPETSFLTSRRNDLLEGQLELELRAPVYVFVEAASSEIEALENELVSAHDRRQRILAYGARFRPSDTLSLDLGVEAVDVDFEPEVRRDLSAKGSSPYVAVTIDGSRTLILGRLVLRGLDAVAGSSFVAYDELAGEISARRDLGWRVSADVQALREIFFSFDADSSHLESDRVRLGLKLELSRIVDLRLFGGIGDDEFFALGTGAVDRIDDATEWGVGVDVQLGAAAQLIFGYVIEDLDSNIDGFDRKFERLGFGLSLSALGGRLTLR